MATTSGLTFAQNDFLACFENHDARQPLLFAEMAQVVPSPAAATVTPLNDALEPIGGEFACELVRESETSITLRHVRPIRSPYFAVRFHANGDARRVLLRLLRCESFGLDFEVLAARVDGAATAES